MADYTLHCFVESGNSYKVALMLALTGADWQPVWNDFFNGGSRTPEFRKLNEFGEVPVLIDHTEGDLVLSQSGVILYHLAGKTGRFKPQNAAEEREVLRWILWDNHKLTSYTATYRFLRKFMGKGQSPEAEFLRGRAFNAFRILNEHLAKADWVAADKPTIADISIAGYMYWPEDVGADWNEYPGIRDWLGRLASLANWAPPEALLPAAPVPA